MHGGSRDGKDGHEDVEFLLADDERDARYAALGYTSLRFSYWEAKRRRGQVLGALVNHNERFLRGTHDRPGERAAGS